MIKDYDIRKVSSFDSVQVTKTNNQLEIIYPKIPPDGSIKILLKSIGFGITDDELEIKHSKGSAKEALNSNNPIQYIFYGFAIIYLILILAQIRNYLVDRLSHEVYYSPYEEILKKSKPWYLSLKKWKKIRTDAIKHTFDDDHLVFKKITDTLCYQLLNSEKHKFISDEEWIQLKLGAEKKLLHLISEKANKGHSWYTEELISLKRPNKIAENSWKEIKSIISKAYKTTLILNIREFNNQEEISNKLKETKPEIMNHEDWETYQSILKKYDKLNKASASNDLLKSQLYKILHREELEEKPEEMTINEWERLKKVEEIFKKSEEIKRDAARLSETKKEVITLKEKIEKQLNIINEVLNDPSAIDRIEDYSNPFSSGNFENLRKIAALNNKRKK